jgi:hypothetical protein
MRCLPDTVQCTQAALTALGHPADVTSASFWTCLVGAAIKHASGADTGEEYPEEPQVEVADRDGVAGALGELVEALEFDAVEMGALDVEGRAELYMDGNDQPKSVPQYLHYSLRGPELDMLSLHDWCRLIVVKPFNQPQQHEQQEEQEENEQLEQHNQPGQRGRQRRGGAGRPSNTQFRFDSGHPLYDSHVQCLRSKHCTLQLQPPPPRMPEEPSASSTKCKHAAAYYTTLLKPWSVGDMPDLSFASWKSWCADLSDDPTCINRYRLAVMTRMSHGMASKTAIVDAARAYRFRNATRWNGEGKDGTENPPGRGPDNGVREDNDVIESQLGSGPVSQQAANALSQLRRLVQVAPAEAKALAAFQANADQVARTVSLTAQSLPRVVRSIRPIVPIRSPATSDQVRASTAAAKRIKTFMLSNVDVPDAAQAEAAPAAAYAGHADGEFDWPSIDALSPSQKAAALKIRCHLPAGSPPPPNPFYICGGPGTGKSYLIDHLRAICDTLGVGIRTTAPAAVAAVPIGGQTLHSLVGLSGTLSPDNFPPPPSTDAMRELRAYFRGVRLLVIDEVSMVGTALLGCASRRLSQILDNEAPFGGLVVVLSGDFDQLTPVKSPSLSHLALGCIPVKPGSPAELSRDIFQKLDMCPLTDQKRCIDADWNAVLNSTRTSRNLRAMTANLHVLSAEESASDPDWAFTPIATNGNDLRMKLNWMQSERWAVHTGAVRVIWKKGLKKWGRGETAPTQSELESMYVSDPRMWHVFIRGLEVVLTKNIGAAATIRGIANGTRCTLAGLAFEDPVKHRELVQQIQQAAPGSTVVLSEEPDFVIVNVGPVGDAPPDLPVADDGGLLLPLKASATAEDDALTVMCRSDGIGGTIGSLKHATLNTFFFDLTFCLTFHKLQGMSLRRLLLDLSKPVNPPHHCFESVLVAASRIGEGKYLRLLPGCDVNHLHRLEGDPKVHAWRQGFPATGGVWNLEHARAALDARQRQQPDGRAGRGGRAGGGRGAALDARQRQQPDGRAGRGGRAGGGRGSRGRGGGDAAVSPSAGRGGGGAAGPRSAAAAVPLVPQNAQPCGSAAAASRGSGGGVRGSRGPTRSASGGGGGGIADHPPSHPLLVAARGAARGGGGVRGGRGHGGGAAALLTVDELRDAQNAVPPSPPPRGGARGGAQ